MAAAYFLIVAGSGILLPVKYTVLQSWKNGGYNRRGLLRPLNVLTCLYSNCLAYCGIVSSQNYI